MTSSKARTAKLLLAVTMWALAGSAALAGEQPEPPAAEPAKPGWERYTRALGRGDILGAKEALAERGIDLAIGFTAVWQANHRGGIESIPEGKLTSSWDATLALDTEALGLWPGGTFFVYLEGSKGTGVGDRYVGSFFGVNGDADSTADHRAQFSEYWYEHRFGGDLLALRVGKMDATVDFDTSAFANDEVSQFLNDALVNNPAVPFPDYALGGQAILRPHELLSLRAGVWDANAEGWTSGRDTALVSDSDWFTAAEVGFHPSFPTAAETELAGNYRLGVWHDPTRYEQLDDGDSAKGESGLYASLDQMVYKERADAADGQGAGLFARYGYAPDHYSEVEHFWSIGGQYQGAIPSRDDDVLGAGMARGHLGSPVRGELRHDTETVYEAYYNVALGYGAALTLDLQYLRHPAGDLPSALVPGVRFQIDF